jgi:hypothetical protein
VPAFEQNARYFNRDCKYATGFIANVGRRPVNVTWAWLVAIQRDGRFSKHRPTFTFSDNNEAVDYPVDMIRVATLHEGVPLWVLFEFDAVIDVTLYKFMVLDARGKTHKCYAPGAFGNSVRLALRRMGFDVTFPPSPMSEVKTEPKQSDWASSDT